MVCTKKVLAESKTAKYHPCGFNNFCVVILPSPAQSLGYFTRQSFCDHYSKDALDFLLMTILLSGYKALAWGSSV